MKITLANSRLNEIVEQVKTRIEKENLGVVLSKKQLKILKKDVEVSLKEYIRRTDGDILLDCNYIHPAEFELEREKI